MAAFTEFLAGFGEEPGYLDFARFGPLSAAVLAETGAQQEALRRVRPGAWDRLQENLPRLQRAAAAATGFRADQVAFQPSALEALSQAVFAITGPVLIAERADPDLRVVLDRAAELLQTVSPVPVAATAGAPTPGDVREALPSGDAAVLVSAVDPETGRVADLDGIRQVIGDRLLVVDADHALGAVEAAWTAADVVVAGGHRWLRAGEGTALLAVSDRAAERLTPALSGVGGLAAPVGAAVPPPAAGAAGLQLARADQAAAGRLAAALEDHVAAGPAAVADAVRGRSAHVVALADEFGLPVVSPRADADRAGVVVLDPLPERLTALTAAFHNHGVSATITDAGRVRLSPHAGTTEETLTMLRSALTAYSLAVRPVR